MVGIIYSKLDGVKWQKINVLTCVPKFSKPKLLNGENKIIASNETVSSWKWAGQFD